MSPEAPGTADRSRQVAAPTRESIEESTAPAPSSAFWVLPAAAALAVLVGAVLRFIAPPDLWLDEAQSVAIARQNLGGLFTGLREDGAPPLYYLLLHGWISVFGQGAFAVRALSGVFSLAALPVAWSLGRRLAGSRVAGTLVLLLASSPFAIRYGSETRMYSLVVLLVLLGGASVIWVVRRPGPWPVVAVAAAASALLLTHYWSIYLLVVTGLLALAGLRRHRAAAVRVLIGLILSVLPFLPWLPTFRWQLAHTGTPWATAGGLRSLTSALTAWQGGGGLPAVLLGDVFLVLAVLAFIAVPGGVAVRLGLTRSPSRWALLALSAGTLVVAGLASLLTSSAVGARYSSVAFPAFLALVALGLTALPSAKAATALLTACVVLGLSMAAPQVRHPRTQAKQVAAALTAAAAGDTVAFCPDQLGPAVSRLAPAGLHLVTYPDLGPADRVDWTDYAQHNEAADPARVAALLNATAGNHALWLVTGHGYRVPSDATCSRLNAALAALRGQPDQVVRRRRDVTESMRLYRFAAPPTPAAS